jgi:hypothetical protein
MLEEIIIIRMLPTPRVIMLMFILMITLVYTAINQNLFTKLLMFPQLGLHRLIVQKVENLSLSKKKKFQKYNIKKYRMSSKTKIIIPITYRKRDKINCL